MIIARSFQAAAGGWTPNSLAGLAFWFKADAIVGLNDGDMVASWTDSSANGFTVSQTTDSQKPLYKTNILNGKPALLFASASNQVLVDANNNIATLTTFPNSVGSVAIVMNANATYYSPIQLSKAASAAFCYNGSGYPGILRANRISGWPSGLPTSASDHYFTIISAASTYDIYQDGVAKSPQQASNWPSAGMNQFQIGWDSNNVYFNGYIYEIIADNTAWDATAQANVETYIKNKYAL